MGQPFVEHAKKASGLATSCARSASRAAAPATAFLGPAAAAGSPSRDRRKLGLYDQCCWYHRHRWHREDNRGGNPMTKTKDNWSDTHMSDRQVRETENRVEGDGLRNGSHCSGMGTWATSGTAGARRRTAGAMARTSGSATTASAG